MGNVWQKNWERPHDTRFIETDSSLDEAGCPVTVYTQSKCRTDQRRRPGGTRHLAGRIWQRTVPDSSLRMRHTLYADTPRLSLRRYYFVHACCCCCYCYWSCAALLCSLHRSCFRSITRRYTGKTATWNTFRFFSQISYYSLIVTGQFTGPDTTICRLRV